MNIFRSLRYSLAVILTLGLSAPLALAHEKGRSNSDRKTGGANEGAALGREERVEKKGIEGREEKSLGKGREERAEKKGVEGREERATRHRGNGRLERRFRSMDRDHAGVITRKEWRGSRAEFDRLDRNHDGVLTRDEFFRR